MDYRALVHEKDEAIYSEIRVIVLDIRGFYVSQTDESRDVFITTFLIKAEHLSVFLFTTGWAVWHHQQERGQGDQSEGRGEAVHVLMLEGGGGGT